MAYRKIDKPKRTHRVLQDITTKNVTPVQNGVTANLAIPCWYMEIRHPQHTYIHDREWHDHIGWPDPVRPDASSQAAYMLKSAPYSYDQSIEGWEHPGRYINMSLMHPIHLLKEGYTKVDVVFDDPPEGLTSSGYIDENEDWVVRFLIHPMCEDAIKEDVNVSYSVFVSGEINGKQCRDIVARGTLRIVAGPIL